MNAQIDFSGFHYRTDRVHEFMTDLLESLQNRHPEIERVDILVRRSFFGTYSTRMMGHLFENAFDVVEHNLDPVECFEKCLQKFRSCVEDAKGRLAFDRLTT